jgi:dinuclear metal center YbgI/SA1388 family protein
MTLGEVENWIAAFLHHNEWTGRDKSLNGLQVGDRNADVRRVAFAVDASMASFEKAAADGADLLVVHHGLFWGSPLAVTEGHFRRLKFLLDHRLGLFASHLPLDVHPEVGNNCGMAEALGLTEVRPFGDYHGTKIGLAGRLPNPLTLERICEILLHGRESALGILPFGKREIQTVGLVSGGASSSFVEAVAEGLDLFVTGDADHTVYHPALEAELNVLFGGHYATETWGVRLLSKVLGRELGLSTVFLDVPTGL